MGGAVAFLPEEREVAFVGLPSHFDEQRTGPAGRIADGVALLLGMRPRRCALGIDVAHIGIQKRFFEKTGGRLRRVGRIGNDAVAHDEGALGGLNKPVDMREAFRLFDVEAIVERQNDEGGEPLRRQRRVVERAGGNLDAEWIGDFGGVAFKIGTRHRTADALKVGGNLVANIAAITVVEARIGKLVERRRQRTLLHQVAGLGRLAAGQELRGKTRRILEFDELLVRELFLAARDGEAFAGVLDRSGEQHIERQAAAERLRAFKRLDPAADSGRHGQRREGTARRNFVVLAFAIEFLRGVGTGRAGGHNGADAAIRLAHQPEAVAADVVHVRIDGGDGRRHGDHGFERIAALGENVASRLGGEIMGR